MSVILYRMYRATIVRTRGTAWMVRITVLRKRSVHMQITKIKMHSTGIFLLPRNLELKEFFVMKL